MPTHFRYAYEVSHCGLTPSFTESAPKMEDDSGMSIFFYFKNNVQQTDTEYLVCDYSCLIGEIGGNLGFFLGGSLLALIDLLADNVTLLPWKKTALY